MFRAPRLACLGVFATGALLASQGGPPPAKVTAARVAEHEFRPTIEILGDVESIRTVDASAEIDGLVEEVADIEGQVVEEGQMLVRLKTTAREIQRKAAEARLEDAQQQLAEYEKGARPEEKKAAEREVAETKAWLDEAEKDQAREKDLLDSGIGSEKAWLAARARAEAMRAQLEKLQAKLELILEGPREEVVARAKAQVAIRRAELDAIADEIHKAKIVAPFRGVLTKKLVEKGAYVRTGDPVASLVQLDPIRVSVAVPEQHVGRVGVGAELELRFDAFPKVALRGKVEAVIPNADRQARSFPVRIRLPNPEHELLPGMVARLALPIAEGRRAVAVPRDALVRGPRGVSVIKIEDGTAKPVPVRTGASNSRWVEVHGALATDDLVVVRGNDDLRPGQKLIVVREEGGSR